MTRIYTKKLIVIIFGWCNDFHFVFYIFIIVYDALCNEHVLFSQKKQ